MAKMYFASIKCLIGISFHLHILYTVKTITVCWQSPEYSVWDGLVCIAVVLALLLTLMAGVQSAKPSLCVSCHIQLICQCSGLFLERLELADQNQDIINLQLHNQSAGEAE